MTEQQNRIDSSEPAFPSVGEGFGDPRHHAPGMSLRDYFAANAPPMPDYWAPIPKYRRVYMSDDEYLALTKDEQDEVTRKSLQQEEAYNRAAWAYMYADEMIERRN